MYVGFTSKQQEAQLIDIIVKTRTVTNIFFLSIIQKNKTKQKLKHIRHFELFLLLMHNLYHCYYYIIILLFSNQSFRN